MPAAGPPPRAPGTGPARCQVCNATPAANATARTVRRNFLTSDIDKRSAVLCRRCGRRLLRSSQHINLAVGWWSLTGFASNLVAIPANAWSLIRVGRMAPPEGAAVATKTGISALAIPAFVAVVVVSIWGIGALGTNNSEPVEAGEPFRTLDERRTAACDGEPNAEAPLHDLDSDMTFEILRIDQDGDTSEESASVDSALRDFAELDDLEVPAPLLVCVLEQSSRVVGECEFEELGALDQVQSSYIMTLRSHRTGEMLSSIEVEPTGRCPFVIFSFGADPPTSVDSDWDIEPRVLRLIRLAR